MRSEYVTVVVPAAGMGARLGGTRKQFRQVDGMSVLVHTLEALRRCREVDSIVVVLPADMDLSGYAQQLGVRAVVHGGKSRRASVLRGLAVIPEGTEIVLIHDAVRPFVTLKQIHAVVAATQKSGAAALAIPAVDTMRYGTEGYFGATVSRKDLYHMQTPQGFRRSILEEALRVSDIEEETDEVSCVQRLGQPVAVVPGSSENFKITHSGDWERSILQWEMLKKCV